MILCTQHYIKLFVSGKLQLRTENGSLKYTLNILYVLKI